MRQNEMHNQRCVVEFAVEVKDGVVNRIGISSIPKPKTNFKGGSVKWFDDRKLIRGGDVAY
ncbi:hypothetical protein ACTNEF_07285 [Bariatricus sp. HCP28S3_E4]|uniref:hypothetical protein n=1 Tax=unclassified Bariatricus TaxID=2677046 RepID=UPI002A8C137F|nr:hypothetical protein [Bariatricus sp.]